MQRTCNAVATLTLLFITAGGVSAADSSNWSDVQALHRGDRIGIIRSDMKRVEGSFEAATPDQITLRGPATTTIAKDDVVRVYVRPRIGRWTRTLIGGVIGAAAGGIVNATLGERLRNEGSDILQGPQAAAAYAGGAAIGAGIGALSGGGDRTVYRRSEPLAAPR